MADYACTSTGADTKDGTSWAKAMSPTEWAPALATASSDDFFWIKDDATHVLVSAAGSTAVDGAIGHPIRVIGVNSDCTNFPPTIADILACTGASRPTIACGSYGFNLDNYGWYENLIVTTSSTWGVRGDNFATFNNVKVTQATANNAYSAIFSAGVYARVINCECIGGTALKLRSGGDIINTYLHDCIDGLTSDTGNTLTANGLIIDTCSGYGVNIQYTNYALNLNMFSIYNTVNTAISLAAAGDDCVLMNGSISAGGGAGVTATATNPSRIDYVNFYDMDGDDVTNVTKGPNCKTVDPQYTDAPGGDFTLVSGSALIDAGLVLFGGKISMSALQPSGASVSSGGRHMRNQIHGN